MALNFGKIIANETQAINTSTPVSSTSPLKNQIVEYTNTTLSFTEKNANSSKVSSNTNIIEAVNSLKDQITQSDIPAVVLPGLPSGLDFGKPRVPNLPSLDSALKALPLPQTVCLGLGNGKSLSEVLRELAEVINSFKIDLPKLKIPGLDNLLAFPLSEILPSLNFNQLLPCSKSYVQIINELKTLCLNKSIEELRDLDPAQRIKQLLDKLQELCGSLQFTQIRLVIDEIQAAQAELIKSIIDQLATPVEKLAKLHDMACDAIEAGANDVLKTISDLAKSVVFDDILKTLLQYEPREAIRLLSDEMKKQAALKNFGAIRKLLDTVNIIKSQAENVQKTFSIPEVAIDQLQQEINKALTLENYEDVSKLLIAYDKIQDDIIHALTTLDPNSVINQGIKLLNQSIAELDFDRYSRILSTMADTLCGQGKDLLPNLPTVQSINPNVLPSFLR